MPFPGAFPPEIWHHIAVLTPIDPQRRKEFLPWLQVAPLTVAKVMHDVAFPIVFGDLHLDAYDEESRFETTLLLSRYTRETELCTAVRDLRVSWDSGFTRTSNRSSDLTEIKRRKVLRLMEELFCDAFQKFTELREIEWSNGKFMKPMLVNPRLHQSLMNRVEVGNLSFLRFSECTFDFVLDLRSATSLSSLHLINVQFTPVAPNPAILSNTNLSQLLLVNVQSLPQIPLFFDPEDSVPDILTTLHLSRVKTLQFGREVSFTKSDFDHIFPTSPGPTSVGDHLRTLRLFDVCRNTLAALSKCGLCCLHELHIDLKLEDALSSDYANQMITDSSSFIGRQKALRTLDFYIADTYRAERFDAMAFQYALNSRYLHEALTSLTHLRRLALGTFMFTLQYPLLDEGVARSLPALEALVIRCVTATQLTETVFYNVSQSVNHYPSLTILGFSIELQPDLNFIERFRIEDAEKAFASALRQNAPRVRYFYMKQGDHLAPHECGAETTVSHWDHAYHMFWDLYPGQSNHRDSSSMVCPAGARARAIYI